MGELNVEISNPVKDVEFDNPIENFYEDTKQTYVHYQTDPNEESIKEEGQRLPLFRLYPDAEVLTINEEFSFSKSDFNTTNDEVSINEEFDQRKTLLILETHNDTISLLEAFTKEHIEPERLSSFDTVTLQEVFAKEHIEPVRRGTDDDVLIQEDFVKDSILTIRESNNDTVTVNEVFSSRVVEVIDVFSTDSIGILESFSKDDLLAPRDVVASHLPDGSNRIEWKNDNDPSHYDLEINVNSTDWDLVDDNIPGSDRQYDHAGCDTNYVDGDSVVYRMRANYSGDLTGWNESGTVSIASCGGGGSP